MLFPPRHPLRVHRLRRKLRFRQLQAAAFNVPAAVNGVKVSHPPAPQKLHPTAAKKKAQKKKRQISSVVVDGNELEDGEDAALSREIANMASEFESSLSGKSKFWELKARAAGLGERDAGFEAIARKQRRAHEVAASSSGQRLLEDDEISQLSADDLSFEPSEGFDQQPGQQKQQQRKQSSVAAASAGKKTPAEHRKEKWQSKKQKKSGGLFNASGNDDEWD